jgi:aspartate carbamoyltransferase catalytic subunit
MTTLRDVTWENLESVPVPEKVAWFRENGRLFHVLFAQQFDRAQLDALGALATRIRFIAKSEEGLHFLQGVLSDKRAMIYFTQPSTRTFLSFCAACEILGIRIAEVRDKAVSSELKGESQEDSVRTFSSYFDLIVMRSEVQGLAERMAWVLSNTDRPVPILNAGSGKDQHPTQALLDVYTLQRSFETRGGIDGKRIAFVGDLARGRTVRSLSHLLTNYRGVTQVFVAPDALQVGADIRDMLAANGVKYVLTDDFESEIPMADAIYMTRLQDEWDAGKPAGARSGNHDYRFGPAQLRRLRQDAVVMHPFPRRAEIDPAVDHDPRAVYWRQMRNGMWIRTALMVTIFGREDRVAGYAGGRQDTT